MQYFKYSILLFCFYSGFVFCQCKTSGTCFDQMLYWVNQCIQQEYTEFNPTSQNCSHKGLSCLNSCMNATFHHNKNATETVRSILCNLTDCTRTWLEYDNGIPMVPLNWDSTATDSISKDDKSITQDCFIDWVVFGLGATAISFACIYLLWQLCKNNVSSFCQTQTPQDDSKVSYKKLNDKEMASSSGIEVDGRYIEGAVGGSMEDDNVYIIEEDIYVDTVAP